MPNSDYTMTNYTGEMKNKLWDDIAPGYYNYGRIDPDADLSKITDLKQSNEDMVQYIIKELGIDKDSHVLEIGCGKGMHVIRIAEITGCEFTGVDLCESYLENDCKSNAEKHGVSEQGEFILGDMTELPDKVKNKGYTHIISLAVVCYAHNVLDKFLLNLAECCNDYDDTQVFIGDFNRLVEWSDCSEANLHVKLPFPLANKQEFLSEVEQSKLKLTKFEDMSEYVIPGYKVIERECRKRDPELKTLTYPLFGKAMMEGKISYVIYQLELK